MSSLSVGGAGSVRPPDREWGVASHKDGVEQVEAIEKVVDDKRTLGPLANGTAVDHDSWTPATDREPVNGYEDIMDSLRTAALRRDAALVDRH